MKDFVMPFLGAVVVFATTFFLLDLAVMTMQGLGLVFHK